MAMKKRTNKQIKKFILIKRQTDKYEGQEFDGMMDNGRKVKGLLT